MSIDVANIWRIYTESDDRSSPSRRTNRLPPDEFHEILLKKKNVTTINRDREEEESLFNAFKTEILTKHGSSGYVEISDDVQARLDNVKPQYEVYLHNYQGEYIGLYMSFYPHPLVHGILLMFTRTSHQVLKPEESRKDVGWRIGDGRTYSTNYIVIKDIKEWWENKPRGLDDAIDL